MITCPNTLGLFNPRVKEICDLVHSVDGLVYYDGANLNAIVGKVRPGDIGFDIVHINLHKTFATPHGGGGPGSGPVGVVEKLVDYMPVSVVIKRDDGTYALEYERPKSIGSLQKDEGLLGNLARFANGARTSGGDCVRASSRSTPTQGSARSKRRCRTLSIR